MKGKKGFTVIEGLLILVIVAIVGFAGWYMWQSKDNSAKSQGPKDCSTATDPDTNREYAQCSVLVRFESKEAAGPVLNVAGLTYRVTYDQQDLYIVAVTVPSGQEKHYVDYFSKQPGVKYAELDGIAQGS